MLSGDFKIVSNQFNVETAVRYPNIVEPKQPQTTPDTASYHSQPKTGGKNEFGEKILLNCAKNVELVANNFESS